MAGILTLGTVAPDFTLPVDPDTKLSLKDLRGKPVILAFYPADWSPVCGDQMALYNEVLPEFQQNPASLNANVVRCRPAEMSLSAGATLAPGCADAIVAVAQMCIR